MDLPEMKLELTNLSEEPYFSSDFYDSKDWEIIPDEIEIKDEICDYIEVEESSYNYASLEPVRFSNSPPPLIPITKYKPSLATPNEVQINETVSDANSTNTVNTSFNFVDFGPPPLIPLAAISHATKMDQAKKKLKLVIEQRVKEKRYICDICKFKTHRKDILVQHMTFHTGKKRFKCDKCDYRSVSKTNMNQHYLSHTGEKPYQCDVCVYKTIWKNCLVKHKQIHERPHRYQCVKRCCTLTRNLKYKGNSADQKLP